MEVQEEDRAGMTSNRSWTLVEDLPAAKNTPPIKAVAELAAGTFESEAELGEFLAFTHAERRREID
jgi:hypothetical protein